MITVGIPVALMRVYCEDFLLLSVIVLRLVDDSKDPLLGRQTFYLCLVPSVEKIAEFEIQMSEVSLLSLLIFVGDVEWLMFSPGTH